MKILFSLLVLIGILAFSLAIGCIIKFIDALNVSSFLEAMAYAVLFLFNFFNLCSIVRTLQEEF